MTVYHPPGGIDGTGATPVEDQLMEWLASVPDGTPGDVSVARFPDDVVFGQHKTLYIANRRWWRLDMGWSRGSHLKALTDYKEFNPRPDEGYLGVPPYPGAPVSGTFGYARGRMQILLKDCVNSGIFDGDVWGAHPNGGFGGKYVQALESQQGYSIKGGADIDLEHCHSIDAYGDGYNVDKGTIRLHVYGESLFERNGRQGMAASGGCTDHLCEDTTFRDIKRSGIDLEPASSGEECLRTTIRHCVFDQVYGFPLAGGGAGKVNETRFEHNQIFGNPHRGRMDASISPTRRRGFYYLDNTTDTSTGSEEGPFRVQRVTGVYVHGNNQPFHEPSASVLGFIRLVDCCPLPGETFEETISGNDIYSTLDGGTIPQYRQINSENFDCALLPTPGSVEPEHTGTVMIAYRRR